LTGQPTNIWRERGGESERKTQRQREKLRKRETQRENMMNMIEVVSLSKGTMRKKDKKRE
jgi:hypothetical protein